MSLRGSRCLFYFLEGPDKVCTQRALVSRANENRPDDVPHVIAERLKIYRKDSPLIRDFLENESSGEFVEIDATASLESVVEQVLQFG